VCGRRREEHVVRDAHHDRLGGRVEERPGARALGVEEREDAADEGAEGLVVCVCRDALVGLARVCHEDRLVVLPVGAEADGVRCDEGEGERLDACQLGGGERCCSVLVDEVCGCVGEGAEAGLEDPVLEGTRRQGGHRGGVDTRSMISI
jgi:hypothetical protein